MNINVLIYIADPFVIENIIKEKNGKERKIYSGLLYELWTIIKKNLVKNN